MRILSAIFWAIVGGFGGAVAGASFGRALGEPIWLGAALGAALAMVWGIIYGLLSPPRRREGVSGRRETRFTLERCAWCGGTGLEAKKGKAGRACAVCDGQGEVLVVPPPRRCSKCKGKGRVILGRRCKLCNGAGWSTYALLDAPPIRHRRSGRRTRTAMR
jgi:hypothetical protein